MASSGQLYSGAYQNAQDLVNRNQLGAEDSLQKSLVSFLSGNTAKYARRAPTSSSTSGARRGARGAGAEQPAVFTDGGRRSEARREARAVPAVKPAPKRALVGNTLTAAPGLKGVKKTRKGNTVTYTASVKRP
jgi:hypothetical protein